MKITLTEGIEKLKALLFSAEKTEEVIEVKFKDEKLEDGVTIISYDADVLAVGVVVFLLDEAGQRLPLPLGDYVTEKGDTFSVVDELGTIDNVVLAPEVEEPKEDAAEVEAPVAAAEAPKAAPKRVIKSQVEEHVFNAFKDEITAEVAKLKAENVELKKQLETSLTINKEMFSVVTELSEQPASVPTEPVKEKFSVSKQRQSFKDSIRELEAKMSIENLK